MKTPEEVAGKVPLSEDWEQSAFEIAEAIKVRDAEHSAALAQSREECERLRADRDSGLALIATLATSEAQGQAMHLIVAAFNNGIREERDRNSSGIAEIRGKLKALEVSFAESRDECAELRAQLDRVVTAITSVLNLNWSAPGVMRIAMTGLAAAIIVDPSQSEPVLSVPIPIPGLPTLSRGETKDARERINPTPRQPEPAKAPSKCENEPCPQCGGYGPPGEWSEGSEVRCDDCGVVLVCDDVEPCFGSSRFSVVNVDDNAGTTCKACKGKGAFDKLGNPSDTAPFMDCNVCGGTVVTK